MVLKIVFVNVYYVVMSFVTSFIRKKEKKVRDKDSELVSRVL